MVNHEDRLTVPELVYLLMRELLVPCRGDNADCANHYLMTEAGHTYFFHPARVRTSHPAGPPAGYYTQDRVWVPAQIYHPAPGHWPLGAAAALKELRR